MLTASGGWPRWRVRQCLVVTMDPGAPIGRGLITMGDELWMYLNAISDGMDAFTGMLHGVTRRRWRYPFRQAC